MKYIIGISAFYHDSAACLLIDGVLANAVQEERFSRIKNDNSFPENSIKFLLKQNNIKASEINAVVFYEKPFLKFERLVETYVANFPNGFSQFKKSLPIWLKEKLFLKNLIKKQLNAIDSSFNFTKIFFEKHHTSHAASAFYPSPFEEAVVLTIDGVGEWETTTISIGNKNKIINKESILYPHSLGLLYSSFTNYLGFRVNSGEYKLMGLAPFGKPKYLEIILTNLIDLKEDGSFRLNQNFFDYSTGLKMINTKFENIFNHNSRLSEKEELTEFHADIAASIQSLVNLAILRICKYAKAKYELQNLCIAGGVALNCVTNGIVQRERIYKNIWVQPAAGDAGGSVGAALSAFFKVSNSNRIVNKYDSMKNSFLGPEFSDYEIENFLVNNKINYIKLEYEEMYSFVANKLSNGFAVGWFQGAMEFGPRSLGSRSILADPRNPNMQKILNLKIKFRESFRPFAPAILEEDKDDWFENCYKNPYMLFVSYISKKYRKKRYQKKDFFENSSSIVPAITHVDYSSRVQTVNRKQNPSFYKLISEFKKITKIPMLVNTSFNVRGEPIVCTPKDAYNCFMSTDLDLLVLNNYMILKENPHNGH